MKIIDYYAAPGTGFEYFLHTLLPALVIDYTAVLCTVFAPNDYDCSKARGAMKVKELAQAHAVVLFDYDATSHNQRCAINDTITRHARHDVVVIRQSTQPLSA